MSVCLSSFTPWVVWPCAQHSVRMIKTVRTAVEAIDESAWQHIEYPDDGEAQIAETVYAGRRLIVRRPGCLARRPSCGPTGGTSPSSQTGPRTSRSSRPSRSSTRILTPTCCPSRSIRTRLAPPLTTAQRKARRSVARSSQLSPLVNGSASGGRMASSNPRGALHGRPMLSWSRLMRCAHQARSSAPGTRERCRRVTSTAMSTKSCTAASAFADACSAATRNGSTPSAATLATPG